MLFFRVVAFKSLCHLAVNSAFSRLQVDEYWIFPDAIHFIRLMKTRHFNEVLLPSARGINIESLPLERALITVHWQPHTS